MKIKKLIPIILCMVLLGGIFAGCGKTNEQTDEINAQTLLVAYSKMESPFLQFVEDGKTLTGFDEEIFKTVFEDIKGDFKTYKFVEVDENHKLGEDSVYTDEYGFEFTAHIMIGGIKKNVGTNNEDYIFTENLIENRIITLTNADSNIKNYADFADTNVGVYSDVAKTAFEKHTAITETCKNINQYDNVQEAVKDLKDKKIDALVIDEFNFRTLNETGFVELDGELDTIEYGIACAKQERLARKINDAVYELKSDQYNDKDEFTPLVEKHFGYNASEFSYSPIEE